MRYETDCGRTHHHLRPRRSDPSAQGGVYVCAASTMRGSGSQWAYMPIGSGGLYAVWLRGAYMPFD